MACKYICQLKTYTMSQKSLNVCSRALLVHTLWEELYNVLYNEYYFYIFNCFFIHRIAVYDLGGGTFDISILEIQKGVFEVRNFVLLVFLNRWSKETKITLHFAHLLYPFLFI